MNSKISYKVFLQLIRSVWILNLNIEEVSKEGIGMAYCNTCFGFPNFYCPVSHLHPLKYTTFAMRNLKLFTKKAYSSSPRKINCLIFLLYEYESEMSCKQKKSWIWFWLRLKGSVRSTIWYAPPETISWSLETFSEFFLRQLLNYWGFGKDFHSKVEIY